MQKLKNNMYRPKFTDSYRNKVCTCILSCRLILLSYIQFFPPESRKGRQVFLPPLPVENIMGFQTILE